ncbi:hypothetical protein J6590_100880 [Homalodisca vitripennis]|nr:hypothetical protein J6590_100880 [Homalodisca vitripennis]
MVTRMGVSCTSGVVPVKTGWRYTILDPSPVWVTDPKAVGETFLLDQNVLMIRRETVLWEGGVVRTREADTSLYFKWGRHAAEGGKNTRREEPTRTAERTRRRQFSLKELIKEATDDYGQGWR